MKAKNELYDFFSTNSYKIIIGEHSQELQDVILVITDLEKIRKYGDHEKPDAAFVIGDVCYGIEHFQISMYRNENGDARRHVLGQKKNRSKLCNTKTAQYDPSIENLFKSLETQIKTHSTWFAEYRENVQNKFSRKKYKLILFIEDTSEPSNICQGDPNELTNIIFTDRFFKALHEYMGEVFGIIYTVGEQENKSVFVFTIEELVERIANSCNRNELYLLLSRLDETIAPHPEDDSATFGFPQQEELSLSDEIEIFLRIKNANRII